MINYEIQIYYKIQIKHKECGNWFFVVATKLQLRCN
jgi:hypothetical protein